MRAEKVSAQKGLSYIDRDSAFMAKRVRYFVLKDILLHIQNTFIVKIFIISLGGIMVINNEMSLGTLFLFSGYLSNLLDFCSRNNDNILELYDYEPAYKKVLSVLKRKESNRVRKIRTGDIALENVCFGYGCKDNTLLKGINLSINHGDKVLIVGESGSGKTTLIKLIIGTIKPNDGNVIISGINFSKKNYSPNIVGVMQNEKIYNLSIVDNITMGDSSIPFEKVVETCKLLGIHEHITNMKYQYNTLIGDDGALLSGGQKQVIILARLLFINAPILILDEATSALDAITEEQVMNAINQRFKDSTILVVSHKKMPTFKYNKLVSVESGQLIMREGDKNDSERVATIIE